MGSRFIFLPFPQSAHEGRIELTRWSLKQAHDHGGVGRLKGRRKILPWPKVHEAYKRVMLSCREKLVGRQRCGEPYQN